MLLKFRVYQLSVEVYHDAKTIKLPSFLKDQLLRAASSVALNLAEGYGKATRKDRERFFSIAFGSTREIQAIMDLEQEAFSGIDGKVDQLAAGVYRLING